MRTTLLTVLALAATLPLTPDADACGGYMGPVAPRMFVVSDGVAGPLVLVDHNVADADKLAWRRVKDRSYDHTQIAPAPQPAHARTFTLVGQKVARTVTSQHAVIVKSTFETWAPTNAMTIKVPTAGRFHIAIEGTHGDARWSDLASIAATAETTAWVKNPPFSPAPDSSYFHVMKSSAGDLETLTTYTDGVAATYTRAPGASWTGGYAGSPHGVVTVDGLRYLVLVEDGIAMPIRV